MGHGNTVSKPELFWKLLWSGGVQGTVMPSFVLLIRFFNDTTLEPRELPIVTEAKEEMEKLDGDEQGRIHGAKEVHGKSLDILFQGLNAHSVLPHKGGVHHS